MARQHVNTTLKKIGATCHKSSGSWICVSKNGNKQSTGTTKRSAALELLKQYGNKHAA